MALTSSDQEKLLSPIHHSYDRLLRSQIVTLNEAQGHHLKYMPYAFTMLGTAMLSSVLRSETAIQTNRKIMRAFVANRQMAELPIAATYLELRREIEKVRSEMDEILSDQNDINESTRAQLDAISTALAALGFAACYQRDARAPGFKVAKCDLKQAQAHWLHSARR